MSERGAGRLAGKVAIVAGAGSQGEEAGIGTGRATAVLFAREGARVVIVDVNPAAAEVTAGLIGAGRWRRGGGLTCCTTTWAPHRWAASSTCPTRSGTG
jgi:NAD(P)-dependent dehydrogenase (short-subunit alcohol dehydrogenase family)